MRSRKGKKNVEADLKGRLILWKRRFSHKSVKSKRERDSLPNFKKVSMKRINKKAVFCNNATANATQRTTKHSIISITTNLNGLNSCSFFFSLAHSKKRRKNEREKKKYRAPHVVPENNILVFKYEKKTQRTISRLAGWLACRHCIDFCIIWCVASAYI